MMKRWIKKILMFSILAMIAVGLPIGVAQAKTKVIKKKITIDLMVCKQKTYTLSGLKKVKKVKITSSKKTVVTAKRKKNKVVFRAKKTGTSRVTIRCYMKKGKRKIYQYSVKVIKSKKMTDLEKSKKAFAIQNQYRQEKGVAKLEWSDEIYEFLLYRMKKSGFDSHKNLARDKNDYFGGFSKYKKLLFAENMVEFTSSPKKAMEMWKSSSGHYRNLMDSEHVCGAIATYKGMWFAIFMDEDASILKDWMSYSLKPVTVKRYDSTTRTYLDNSSFGYYEESDKDGTLRSERIRDTSGEQVYLLVGKTYVFYEKLSPDGYEKANKVTITITENSGNEIILKN